jgi:CDP-diacylglycerol--glycerol-3-phosphate 3-phosphatidyltransferase
MPSVYQLKPAFQRLLRPPLARLAALGVTPNHLTVSALILSAAVGGVLAAAAGDRRALLLLPPFLFLRMALNAMDGMLARESGLSSDLGAVLNEVGDVLSDVFLYLPLALWSGFSAPAMVGIALGSVLSEFCGLLPKALGASRRYDGPMGKSDRAFVFGALGLALGLGCSAGAWLLWAQWAILGLLALTLWRRLSRGLAELKR